MKVLATYKCICSAVVHATIAMHAVGLLKVKSIKLYSNFIVCIKSLIECFRDIDILQVSMFNLSTYQMSMICQLAEL